MLRVYGTKAKHIRYYLIGIIKKRFPREAEHSERSNPERVVLNIESI